MPSRFYFKTLTQKNWRDFETLFGPRGACGGCWCMTWRLHKSEYDKGKSGGNRKAMARLVNSGNMPGILAYCDKEPIGWCAFAPRQEYKRLESSRVLKPVDDKSVWSITCFFIRKDFRRKGVSGELLNAVIRFAKKNGVKMLEAYPVVPYSDKIPAVFAWTGFPSVFRKAHFLEVARRSRTRPIMRLSIR